jgi:hypothetical protein
MAYSRTRGEIVASGGFYVGRKNTETAVVVGYPVTFASASTVQTVYTIVPNKGTVKAVYVCADAASQAAVYTVTHGSAGDVLATATATSGSAGTVSTLTLGTVACTAGEAISVTRASCGTTGVSTVTISLAQTA